MQCPDVYEDRCPTRLVLDRIADKWAVLILNHLRGGPVRFNQIRRTIKGISQKVLSQTLKKLERDGLISRSVFATVPVTVEYALTPLGRTLTDTIAALAHWAEDNIQAVLAAQQAYDAGSGPAGPAQGDDLANAA
jgi:DNA-binding HxlR family transcriptional regulator